MAGFVLADPRFTKQGASAEVLDWQRKEVTKALDHHATEMAVYISDERRKEVEQKGWAGIVSGNINERQYITPVPGGAAGQSMKFIAKRVMDGVPGGRGKQLWAVYYGPKQRSMPSSPFEPNKAPKGELLPVMALVDPHCAPELKGTYRSAQTGDYDLWAVFPRAGTFKGAGADKRPVPGSDRFVVPFKVFDEHEHKHMGNITARVIEINAKLNAAIRAAGYTGGNAVHHSDEAGRPMVREVELNFIAFVPNDPQAYFIPTLADLKDFFRVVIKKYHITLNPGWQRQLGFGATPKGSWEV